MDDETERGGSAPTTPPAGDTNADRVTGAGIPQDRPIDAGSPGDRPIEGAAPAQTASAPRPTAVSRLWMALALAVVLVILLIIFIAENSRHVTVSFLGAHGTLSLAFAILISALAGVAITLLVGSARIVQLRREMRELRRHRHHR